MVEADFYHAGSLLPLTDAQVRPSLSGSCLGQASRCSDPAAPSQMNARLTHFCQACTSPCHTLDAPTLLKCSIAQLLLWPCALALHAGMVW